MSPGNMYTITEKHLNSRCVCDGRTYVGRRCVCYPKSAIYSSGMFISKIDWLKLDSLKIMKSFENIEKEKLRA